MSDPSSPHKKVVLVDDDEQWYVEPLKDALEYKGYEVVVARTGGEGLSKIKEVGPDLVILDVMMDPGDLTGNHGEGRRTGRLLLEKVRHELKLDATSLPVICLSVLQDEDLREAMTCLGADFLCKQDVELSEVLRRIQAKLGTTK
jgi:DNA-binding response OmpR family regulator